METKTRKKKRKKISTEVKENSKWGYLQIIEDGHIRFQDPTKDYMDPNSGHTGGYKTIGVLTKWLEENVKVYIKKHIYKMKKEGVFFVDEATDEIYSQKEVYDKVLIPQAIFFRLYLPRDLLCKEPRKGK